MKTKSMKSKLYWTEPEDKQAQISKALSKRRIIKQEIDENPILTKQIREAVLAKTNLGEKQLQTERNELALNNIKNMVQQREYIVKELKNAMPELTELDIKQIMPSLAAPQKLAPITVKTIGANSKARIDEILKLIDTEYTKSGKITSLQSAATWAKKKYGRLPWGFTKAIQSKIDSLGPSIEILEEKDSGDDEVTITKPSDIEALTKRIKQQSPKKKYANLTIDDVEDELGGSLKLNRKVKGGGILSSIFNYGKKQVSNAVKSKVQDLHDKPLDAIEGAFKIGNLLRKEYLKANAKDEDIKKEEAGKLHIKIPKAHQTKILKALKSHPKMKNLRGAGIWSSLVKGFTLPLRVISRLGTAVDLPVVSQIAKGFGAVSDIMTDSAGTTPLI